MTALATALAAKAGIETSVAAVDESVRERKGLISSIAASAAC